MRSLAQSPRIWSRKHTNCDYLDARGRQSGGENDQNFRNSRKFTEWPQIAPEGSTTIEKHLGVGNVTSIRIYWLHGSHLGPKRIQKDNPGRLPRNQLVMKNMKNVRIFRKVAKWSKNTVEVSKKHRKGSGSRNQALQQ